MILESESPGGKLPETRDSATGCPGVAASSPALLLRQGRAARTAAVQGSRSHDRESTTGFSTCSARCGKMLAEAFMSPPPRRLCQARNTRTMRSGVAGPGPHSIFLIALARSTTAPEEIPRNYATRLSAAAAKAGSARHTADLGTRESFLRKNQSS